MQYLYNGSPVPTPVKASDLAVAFPGLIAEFDRQIAERVLAEHETLCKSLEHLGFSTEGPNAPQGHITENKVLKGGEVAFSDEDEELIEGALE